MGAAKKADRQVSPTGAVRGRTLTAIAERRSPIRPVSGQFSDTRFRSSRTFRYFSDLWACHCILQCLDARRLQNLIFLVGLGRIRSDKPHPIAPPIQLVEVLALRELRRQRSAGRRFRSPAQESTHPTIHQSAPSSIQPRASSIGPPIPPHKSTHPCIHQSPTASHIRPALAGTLRCGVPGGRAAGTAPVGAHACLRCGDPSIFCSLFFGLTGRDWARLTATRLARPAFGITRTCRAAAKRRRVRPPPQIHSSNNLLIRHRPSHATRRGGGHPCLP
jgi:hypothetical protein